MRHRNRTPLKRSRSKSPGATGRKTTLDPPNMQTTQSRKSNMDLFNVINGDEGNFSRSKSGRKKSDRQSQSAEGGSQWGLKSLNNFSPRSNQMPPFSNGTLQNGFTSILLSGDQVTQSQNVQMLQPAIYQRGTASPMNSNCEQMTSIDHRFMPFNGDEPPMTFSRDSMAASKPLNQVPASPLNIAEQQLDELH